MGFYTLQRLFIIVQNNNFPTFLKHKTGSRDLDEK
jgi:hypothetical protein